MLWRTVGWLLRAGIWLAEHDWPMVALLVVLRLAVVVAWLATRLEGPAPGAE